MSAQSPFSSVIHQLHPDTASSIKEVREQFHQRCGYYLNRNLHVKTVDGNTYEGIVTAIDSGHLFLSVPAQTADLQSRAYFPPHAPYPGYPPYPPANPGRVILPLVLYELLVVSLL
ncbi:hypothetical protein [Paenibacillus pinistramenti]|uniref:hypothetical protein n=1 Tax=Paenibacillus pinistramenti TaxID=1768003 RepID=UPI001108FD6F|nr:hypothetical protein [Paenibacillus pinistramenti]